MGKLLFSVPFVARAQKSKHSTTISVQSQREFNIFSTCRKPEDFVCILWWISEKKVKAKSCLWGLIECRTSPAPLIAYCHKLRGTIEVTNDPQQITNFKCDQIMPRLVVTWSTTLVRTNSFVKSAFNSARFNFYKLFDTSIVAVRVNEHKSLTITKSFEITSRGSTKISH